MTDVPDNVTGAFGSKYDVAVFALDMSVAFHMIVHQIILMTLRIASSSSNPMCPRELNMYGF